MAGIANNGARATFLANILNQTAPSNMTLRIFQNNITPADTDTVALYTESTFTGYAGTALTAASWSITTAHPAVATYPQVTFTSSANQTAQSEYGYYITNAAGALMFAERFSDGPYSVSVLNQTIKVTPTVSLTD